MQQINLFNPNFSTRKRFLSTRTVIFICILALTANLAALAYFSYLDADLGIQIVKLQKMQQQQQAEIKKITAKLVADNSEQTFQQRLHELQNQITAEKQQMEAIRTALGHSGGYSVYMRALAGSGLDNVWLTGMTISGNDENTQLRLSAATLYPALVPDYLQILRRQALFNGKGGPSLKLGRFETDKKGYLVFDLTTAGMTVQP